MQTRPTIYYKVPAISVSGQRFEGLHQLGVEAVKEANNFLKEHGFDAFTALPDSYLGGLSGCARPNKTIPRKAWKNSKGVYTPKNNSAGREIFEKFKNLPVVGFDRVSEIAGIDFNGEDKKQMGFLRTKNFFLVSMFKDWLITPPEDFQEISEEEFNILQK